MAALSLSIDGQRPMNRWDHDRIQPGVAGSVGDVNIPVRLRTSTPGMRLRYDPAFSGQNSIDKGSNIQNGGQVGYSSGGGCARTIDSNWGGRRHFKVRHGWIIQDLRQPDKLVTPYLGSTGDYSWQNKVATIYEAKRTGSQFLPLPGGYAPHPGEINRGGNGPRVTDIAGGDFEPSQSIVSRDDHADHPGRMNHENGTVTGARVKQTIGGIVAKAIDETFGARNKKPRLGR